MAGLKDMEITAKIKGQLLSEDFGTGSSIDVDTSNGVVTLSGNVPTLDFKSKAEQIARNTNGVNSVHNELNVGQNR